MTTPLRRGLVQPQLTLRSFSDVAMLSAAAHRPVAGVVTKEQLIELDVPVGTGRPEKSQGRLTGGCSEAQPQRLVGHEPRDGRSERLRIAGKTAGR